MHVYLNLPTFKNNNSLDKQPRLRLKHPIPSPLLLFTTRSPFAGEKVII